MTLRWTGQTARTARRTAAMVVLVALLGWLLLRLGDASQVAAALEGFLKRPALLALFLGSYTAAFALRAVAWRLLLPGNTGAARAASGAGVVRLFGILQVALLANHIFPTKAGEVARVGLLARAGVPLATATGSTLVARLLDLAALCLVALALGPFAGVPGGHFETLVAPLALAGLAFGAAIGGCLLLGSGRLAPLWRRLPGRVARAAGLAQGAVAGAAATPPLHLAGAATVTLLSWLLEAGALWCTARAAGVPLAPATAATATAVTIALQGMQFTPGGLGLYETSLTGSLAVLGVPPGVGLSLALATHALKFAYAYTVGPLCLAVLALIPVVGRRGIARTSSPDESLSYPGGWRPPAPPGPGTVFTSSPIGFLSSLGGIRPPAPPGTGHIQRPLGRARGLRPLAKRKCLIR